jgi:hypothetical protein
MSNTYVIGDVHGCYYTLLDLVGKLPETSNMNKETIKCATNLNSRSNL